MAQASLARSLTRSSRWTRRRRDSKPLACPQGCEQKHRRPLQTKVKNVSGRRSRRLYHLRRRRRPPHC
eukprot:scaffold94_cov254-Pinguiococcus_pyrenoidosus.AAC.14